MTTAPSLTSDFDDIVTALTALARTRTREGDAVDVAEFVCLVLAATAANVVGPDLLLAARPGSWESETIYELLVRTMGEDPDEWGRYRTEAVAVPLNVAELIETGDLHPGLLGLDDAQAELDHRFDGITEAACDEYERELERLADRYGESYRDYGRHFAEAVRRIAASVEYLQVPPQVVVDADPISHWWEEAVVTNPGLCEDDPLVLRLWWAAHDLVSLPNVDIRPEARP